MLPYWAERSCGSTHLRQACYLGEKLFDEVA